MPTISVLALFYKWSQHFSGNVKSAGSVSVAYREMFGNYILDSLGCEP